MAQAVMMQVAEPQQAVVDSVVVSSVVVEAHKKNRIQVSNTKKPLFFYLNLAKRYIKQHNDVELSALGMAIPTVVTIAEILKANGVAVEKKVLTSTVGSKDENKGRLVQKAKIEIVLEKNEKSGNQKTSPEIADNEPKTETTETELKTETAETEPKSETAKLESKSETESKAAEAEKKEG